MKGVLTTRVIPDYNDLPERQYHFPRTYLRQVERLIGDWIIYYEPRRSSGDQPGGRQAYFATAQVTGVRRDPDKPDHFYADIQRYFDFPRPVPFREGQDYYESILRRPEVQAAHIMPVEHNGPDTVRNGIALSATVHWMFDRGLISFGDDGNILTSPHGLPDDMNRLIRPERRLLVPDHPALRPHPGYLAWHREHQFKR